MKVYFHGYTYSEVLLKNVIYSKRMLYDYSELFHYI